MTVIIKIMKKLIEEDNASPDSTEEFLSSFSLSISRIIIIIMANS